MYEHDVLGPSKIPSELSCSFEERHGFHVSDRTTQFHDSDIRTALPRDGCYPPLDLICDVRYYLHRLPKVVPVPLVLDDRPVHLTCGDVMVAVQIDIQESLIITEIEIHLSPIIENEHLTMLIWIHRTRIYVEIRIDLDHRYVKTTCLQQTSDRRCCYPLSETGNHSAADENQLHIINGICTTH